METTSRCVLTFLVNSAWQIPLIAAVAALASWLMRNGSAGYKHAVWLTALLAGILLPLASIGTSDQDTPLLFAVSYAPQGIATEPSIAIPAIRPALTQQSRSVSFTQGAAALLLVAYLLFLLFRLARLTQAWMRTIQIRQAARRRAAPLLVEHVWARCLEAFGLDGVELLSSASLSAPAALGLRRKTVILPVSFFGESSEDVLKTAIGHEMAHIARHDFALNSLCELLLLPISFHPAAWVIRRGIERTREIACDELVTRQLLAPRVYANSMVAIAAGLTRSRCQDYTLGVFDGNILEERIRHLIEQPASSMKHARLLMAAGVSTLALCSVIASGLALSARAQGGSSAEMSLAGEAHWPPPRPASALAVVAVPPPPPPPAFDVEVERIDFVGLSGEVRHCLISRLSLRAGMILTREALVGTRREVNSVDSSLVFQWRLSSEGKAEAKIGPPSVLALAGLGGGVPTAPSEGGLPGRPFH